MSIDDLTKTRSLLLAMKLGASYLAFLHPFAHLLKIKMTDVQ